MDIDALRAQLTCPITKQVIKNPVRTPYGHLFERLAIQYHVRQYKNCPVTRKPLTIDDLKWDKEAAEKL